MATGEYSMQKPVLSIMDDPGSSLQVFRVCIKVADSDDVVIRKQGFSNGVLALATTDFKFGGEASRAACTVTLGLTDSTRSNIVDE